MQLVCWPTYLETGCIIFPPGSRTPFDYVIGLSFGLYHLAESELKRTKLRHQAAFIFQSVHSSFVVCIIVISFWRVLFYFNSTNLIQSPKYTSKIKHLANNTL